jgi:two-component system NtrC family sensor kinase
VAHEINNPLASVVTYSRLLLKRFRNRHDEDAHAAENLQILEAIASESARSGEIVSNLLLFARRTGSHLEPTDVNEVMRRSLFLIKHKMDLAQARLDDRLADGLPAVLADPAQVEQAILALLINAVEAMPGGGTVTVASAAVGNEAVRVAISDTGVGMTEEVRAHVFEPFFTTKGDRNGKGLGLGLAVVFGIIERHSGTIEVASAPNQGATFTLTIPVGGPKPTEETS